MNVQLALKIADLALAAADRQLYGIIIKVDPFFEDTLKEIIQRAAEAYREHTGKPLDPALIEAEDPA